MRLAVISTGILFVAFAAPPARAGDIRCDGPCPDEIVVSASRVARDARASAPAVTVIDAGDIAAAQASFALDALRGVPGLSIAQAGPSGGVASVRLRGAAGSQTLVVFDGVTTNDPSAPQGGFDFSTLDGAAISRIEVLRGPQGILYGSEAIGGVISIETAPPEGPAAALRLEGGSLGTARGSADLALGDADGFARLVLAGTRTDGVSRFDGGAEKDGYRNGSALLKAGARLAGQWRGDVTARASVSKAEIDGFPPPFFAFGDTDERQTSDEFLVAARARREGETAASLALSYAAIDRRSFDGAFETFSAEGGRLGADALIDAPLTNGVRLVAGGRTERTAARVSGVDEDATTAGVFALLEASPTDRVHLSAGVRRDEYSDFKGATTARVSAAINASERLTLRASWGEGFRAPSLFERYYDEFGVVPNPDLRPEKGSGFDAGAEWRDGLFSLRAGYFQLGVKDQIDFDLARFGYYNIERTRSRGTEVAAELGGDRARVGLSYTYTDAEDRDTGAPLLRIPKHLANGAVTVEPIDGLSLAASLSWNGRETDFPSDNEAFLRLDLRASYEISRKIEAFARVENATDTDYQDISGYGEPGAAAYAGLRVQL